MSKVDGIVGADEISVIWQIVKQQWKEPDHHPEVLPQALHLYFELRTDSNGIDSLKETLGQSQLLATINLHPYCKNTYLKAKAHLMHILGIK
jgi:hypothetical protein